MHLLSWHTNSFTASGHCLAWRRIKWSWRPAVHTFSPYSYRTPANTPSSSSRMSDTLTSKPSSTSCTEEKLTYPKTSCRHFWKQPRCLRVIKLWKAQAYINFLPKKSKDWRKSRRNRRGVSLSSRLYSAQEARKRGEGTKSLKWKEKRVKQKMKM